MIVIADVGNNHFGSLEVAKDMIRAAKDSGADLVKFQAFRALDLIGGSMPLKFYEECELNPTDCLEIIERGKEVGVPVFFSIFNDDYNFLHMQQDFHKIAASQTKSFTYKELWEMDSDKVFVSTNDLDVYPFTRASLMFASPYFEKKEEDLTYLDAISILKRIIKRSEVGYSCHNHGFDAVERAVKYYGCQVIEKHFTPVNNMQWNGIMFRDTVHGLNPSNFEKMCKRIK